MKGTNYTRNKKTLSRNNKLVRRLDSHNTRISWYRTVRLDTKKVSTSNFADMSIDDHRDSIQVLLLTKVYHFDDPFTCFVKYSKDSFISRLAKFPIIFNRTL